MQSKIAIGLSGKKGQGLVSRAIKLGQWIRRYKPEERCYSHAFLIIGEDEIVEAQKRGVVRSKLSHYKPDDITVIPVEMGPVDEQQVVAFARNVVETKTKYGFWTFAGLVVYVLTVSVPFIPTLFVQQAGTAICSGFVSDALTRAGYIWAKPPFAMMPADLARHFGGLTDLRVDGETYMEQ